MNIYSLNQELSLIKEKQDILIEENSHLNDENE